MLQANSLRNVFFVQEDDFFQKENPPLIMHVGYMVSYFEVEKI